MKKTELVSYQKKSEHLLLQFEEVKVLHVRRAVNTRADALAALMASLSVPEGEICHITILGQRLQIPLPKTSSESLPEGAYNVKMVADPVEDWWIPFLNFLE